MKKVFIQILTICMFFTQLNGSENKLNFIIFVSDDVESFDFNKTKREYIYEERASAIFFVSGFNVDKSKKVDLSSSIRVLTPENKYIAHLDLISSNAVIQDNQEQIPLNGIYDLYFGNNDPLGTYWLEVTITDNISKKSITKKMSILLFDNVKSKNIIMKPVQSAKHLDELWEDYFRSKNPWAIKRIISALRYIDSKDTNSKLVGHSARWSLESNAFQHKEVLKICKDSLNIMPPNIKKRLVELILEIEKKIKDE